MSRLTVAIVCALALLAARSYGMPGTADPPPESGNANAPTPRSQRRAAEDRVWLDAIGVHDLLAPGDANYTLVFGTFVRACACKFDWADDSDDARVCAIKYVCALELPSSTFICGPWPWPGGEKLTARPDARRNTISRGDTQTACAQRRDPER